VESLAIIASSADVYLSWLIADLARQGAVPNWVFLGSTAERRLFAVRSLLRIRKRHGWREVFFRIVDRRKRVEGSIRGEHLSFETLHSRLGFEVLLYDHVDSGALLLDLIEKNPSLLLLAGCGIVSPSVLSVPRLGVLNCHPAILPGARGVDVVDWSVLENLPTGVTAHFAIPQVDAGDIVVKLRVEPNPGESWTRFAERVVRTQAECLAEAAVTVLSGNYVPQPNDTSQSRLFFATRRRDRRLAESKFIRLVNRSHH
jgi:methionyl-tRNA formyltransferase